jgi:predicted RNase H-like HicB family nuclease
MQFSVVLVLGLLLVSLSIPCVSLEASSTTLIINEVLYDPSGDEASGEFVEIYVQSSPGNLNGYELTDQDDHTYTFPSFTPSDGDYIVVHTGTGTDDTDSPVIHLYWGRGSGVWNNDGDDVLLTDGTNVDYIAYESGTAINDPPSGLSWSGTNPSNSGTEGTSVSLINNGVDGDTGNDWEKSGTTDTYGPTTEGADNNEDPTTITLSSLTARPITSQPTFFRWQWLALASAVVAFGGVAAARRSLGR